jgi:hypothetical protein
MLRGRTPESRRPFDRPAFRTFSVPCLTAVTPLPIFTHFTPNGRSRHKIAKSSPSPALPILLGAMRRRAPTSSTIPITDDDDTEMELTATVCATSAAAAACRPLRRALTTLAQAVSEGRSVAPAQAVLRAAVAAVERATEAAAASAAAAAAASAVDTAEYEEVRPVSDVRPTRDAEANNVGNAEPAPARPSAFTEWGCGKDAACGRREAGSRVFGGMGSFERVPESNPHVDRPFPNCNLVQSGNESNLSTVEHQQNVHGNSHFKSSASLQQHVPLDLRQRSRRDVLQYPLNCELYNVPGSYSREYQGLNQQQHYQQRHLQLVQQHHQQPQEQIKQYCMETGDHQQSQQRQFHRHQIQDSPPRLEAEDEVLKEPPDIEAPKVKEVGEIRASEKTPRLDGQERKSEGVDKGSGEGDDGSTKGKPGREEEVEMEEHKVATCEEAKDADDIAFIDVDFGEHVDGEEENNDNNDDEDDCSNDDATFDITRSGESREGSGDSNTGSDDGRSDDVEEVGAESKEDESNGEMASTTQGMPSEAIRTRRTRGRWLREKQTEQEIANPSRRGVDMADKDREHQGREGRGGFRRAGSKVLAESPQKSSCFRSLQYPGMAEKVSKTVAIAKRCVRAGGFHGDTRNGGGSRSKAYSGSQLGRKRKMESDDDDMDYDYRTGETDTEDESEDDSEAGAANNLGTRVREVSKARTKSSAGGGGAIKRLQHPLVMKHGSAATAVDCIPDDATDLDLVPGMYIRASILFDYVTALSNKVYEECLEAVLAIQTSQYWTLRCVCYGRPQTKVKRSKKCQCGWRVTMRVANISATSNAKERVGEADQREAQMQAAILRINSFLPIHTGHQPAPYGSGAMSRRPAARGSADLRSGAPNTTKVAHAKSSAKRRKQTGPRRATPQRPGVAILYE